MNTYGAASVHSGARDSARGTGGANADEGQTEVADMDRAVVKWRQHGNGGWGSR